MLTARVDALWVRSTDRFLNEYVPPETSARVWLSGFTGSLGEALVTSQSAAVFVDGRYWIQAEREVPVGWAVVRVPHGRSIDDVVRERVTELGAITLGVESSRWTLSELDALRAHLPESTRVELLDPSPVEEARRDLDEAPGEAREPELRVVPDDRLGHAAADRLARLFEGLPEEIDAVWIHRLDDLAYLSGLRARDLPNQATFRGVGLATRHYLLVGLSASAAPRPGALPVPREVKLVTEGELWESVGGPGRGVIGVDPRSTPAAVEAELRACGVRIVRTELPLDEHKAVKTDLELAVMKDAFQRADRAVWRTIRWACDAVVGETEVTEASFSAAISENFAAEGALGQSFRTIAAAGENGAIIHYGDASPERRLARGELMLVDCGGHFFEGYATDLTRTFLVGAEDDEADARQRDLYTHVLRAAIAGMSARFPVGTTGGQLDAIVRAPLWSRGLVYAHGTGHGVGINVHEFPPRLSPNHTSVLVPNMVFSIEPGVYVEGYGGVRIENLCTVRPCPELDGFLEVVPLTFCPLDDRLIDRSQLTASELAFLDWYEAQFEAPASIR